MRGPKGLESQKNVYAENMSLFEAYHFFDRVKYTLKPWRKAQENIIMPNGEKIKPQELMRREKIFLLGRTNFNPGRWAEFLRFKRHQKSLLYPGHKW